VKDNLLKGVKVAYLWERQFLTNRCESSPGLGMQVSYMHLKEKVWQYLKYQSTTTTVSVVVVCMPVGEGCHSLSVRADLGLSEKVAFLGLNVKVAYFPRPDCESFLGLGVMAAEACV
jgi:hypothetical protein